MRKAKYDDWAMDLVGVAAVVSLLGLLVIGGWACFIWLEPTPSRTADDSVERRRQFLKRFEREMHRTRSREDEEKYRKALERLDAAARSGDPREMGGVVRLSHGG